MNKAELIAKVSVETGFSRKDTEKIVNAAFDSIISTLAQGDRVQLVGFGAFEIKERAARLGRNPKTREEIRIPESRVATFKVGKVLKEAVSK